MEMLPAGMDTEGDSFPEELFAWLEGDDSPEVRAAVEAWASESSDRWAGLREFAQTWRLSRAPGAPVDWEELEARLDRLEAWRDRRPHQSQPRRARRTGWRLPLQAAAVLLVGVGLGLLAPRLREYIGPDQVAKVVVPAGSQIVLQLPGGIDVRLNSATELSYKPSRDVREVHLEGEAFFTVPEGAKRNLLVHTEAGTVRDLGTEFNVRARSGRTAVVVTTGQVALESPQGVVALEAGEESAMSVGAAPAAPAPASLDPALGWLSGRLVYYDESLAEVAAELERRFGVAVRVAESLRDKRLAVSIDAQTEANAAVRLVCQAVDARCGQVAGAWLIQARK